MVDSLEKRDFAMRQVDTTEPETERRPASPDNHETIKDIKPPAPTQRTPRDDQVPLSVNTSMMKRDFKIVGQRDRITFSSLMRQIDAGHEKGYSDKELIEGVIRSISAGMRLRSYLESKEDLTLSTLRNILEVFKEGDATSLYKELSFASQGQNKSCQEFVIRLLDLRQKIVQASKRVDAPLRYDPDLVQKLFLDSLSTGITNGSIRMELRLLLSTSLTSRMQTVERPREKENKELSN